VFLYIYIYIYIYREREREREREGETIQEKRTGQKMITTEENLATEVKIRAYRKGYSRESVTKKGESEMKNTHTHICRHACITTEA